MTGILLLISTVCALLMANSPWQSAYHQLLHAQPFGLPELQHWINDGLMVIFFAVVAMEIKREVVDGVLSSRQKAAFPILGALGGMLVPALLYFLFNRGFASGQGWGIPMATDIAFAIGVLSILGKRAPRSLHLFLLSLAVVDDLGAILVIAVFYGGSLAMGPFIATLVVLGAMLLLRHFKIRSIWLWSAAGLLLWAAILMSGVHATIAGVLFGFLAPVDRFEKFLHSWSHLLILPLFAFFNAGVTLSSTEPMILLTHPVALGVIYGLVIGKPLGIFLFSWLGTRLGLAEKPVDSSWLQIFAVSCLAGIGFTMSLFIANLAFPASEFETVAKLAILVASILATTLAAGLFMIP